jgi:hypothetical protein
MGFQGLNKDNSWWPSILQKAAAKYYTTYDQLNYYGMIQAFYALTGMPTYLFSAKKFPTVDAYWEHIKMLDQKNYLFTGGMGGYGFTANHAYTIIGVAEYKGNRLIKLRNPRNWDTYNGPWNDKDTVNWTEDAKQALKH